MQPFAPKNLHLFAAVIVSIYVNILLLMCFSCLLFNKLHENVINNPYYKHFSTFNLIKVHVKPNLRIA